MLGGRIETGEEVTRIAPRPGDVVVRTRSGRTLVAGKVVACAGVQSDRVAALTGNERRARRIAPFRGDYYVLKWSCPGARPRARLPRPRPGVPLPRRAFHAADGRRGLGGAERRSRARTRGLRTPVPRRSRRSRPAGLSGTRRLARRYARTGAAEIVRDVSRSAALRQMRRYIPALERRHVRFGPSGIRAQVLDVSGALVDDFVLERDGHVLHVVNAPSPAATASLAIGQRLARELAELT